MEKFVTIDKAGRLELPDAICEALQLAPGDKLELELDLTSGSVTIKPRRPKQSLQRERRVWVYSTGEPLPAQEVRDAILETRDQRSRAHRSRVP
ncbi:MAG: AbrB/MazE/SpoVT family DNA-binding domain-containing protein [Xanthomonadales bacterium]|nr:AbrB/MazE/SpoVT family DNA-binding domain-containing protein [Xanthomonadales bacterium]